MQKDLRVTEKSSSAIPGLLASLLLVAAVGFVFSQSFHYGFVSLDDQHYIRNNPDIPKGLTPDGIKSAFSSTRGFMYIPLTWLSYMADFSLYGMSPGGFHFTNVLLHLANALLLFFLLRRMTGADWPSALVALLFAAHPTRVESVVWITERKDVLYGFFWLLALWAYVLYTEKPGLTRYLAVPVLMTLSALAKPMAVTLPAVLILLDYWPLGRYRSPSAAGWLDRKRLVFLLAEKVPLFVISLFFSVVAVAIMENRAGLTSIEALPIGMRMENALVSYASYIRMFLWPTGLAPFYPLPPEGFSRPRVILSGLVIALILLASLREIRRRPYLPVGFLFFAVSILPVSGLFQNGDQVMADRFCYMPLVGLAIMAAFLLAEVLGPAPDAPRRRQLWGLLILACFLLPLCAASLRQALYWRSNESLYGRALAVVGDNDRVHGLLGKALMDAGKWDQAMKHFEKALSLNPHLQEVRLDVGNLYEKQGKLEQALAWYTAEKLNFPGSIMARYNMGRVLDKLGRRNEAMELYRFILVSSPGDWATHNALGAALSDQGRLSEAEAEFRKALSINPGYAEALTNMGVLLMRQNRLKDALALFIMAQRFAPDYAPAWTNMGLLLYNIGRFPEARACYGKALSLAPNDAGLHNNMGILFAAQGEPAKARAQFQRALAIAPGYREAAENLSILNERSGLLNQGPAAGPRTGVSPAAAGAVTPASREATTVQKSAATGR